VLIYFMSGTSILIVVGVALDMVEKLNALLVMRNYEGFLGDAPPSGASKPGAAKDGNAKSGTGKSGNTGGTGGGWGRRSS
jgi:hypothetical protein